MIGEPVRHHAIGFEDYARLGFPGAEDLANMFHFQHDFQEAFCARRSVEATRALHPGLLSFEAWARLHADALRAAAGARAG